MAYEFADRANAGRRLADRLAGDVPGDALVCALPRGGVPVAAEICRRYSIPMDLAFVRKIGAPGQPELALGAVVDGDDPHIAINMEIARSFGLGRAEVEAMAKPHLEEIERRKALYLAGRAPAEVKGRTVIVVDDGIATGATMRAALEMLKARGAGRIVLALPVAPSDTLDALAGMADEIVCLLTPSWFMSVGAHYDQFDQVGDEEVARTMETFAGPNARETGKQA